MTYQQALAYIHGTLKFGSKPGLKRIRALLERLGNPQDHLKFIHITGTNGKGSTASMLESILRYAGYKTGLYISPYLETFCERIQVGRQMIPERDVAAWTRDIQAAIGQIEAEGGESPTEFEIVTAMAFCHFNASKCNIVALEVGMGGENDATNIIPGCEAAVIGPISLDHTDVFGNSVEAIAREKSGIIKPGCHVVCCAGQDPAALEIIKAKCEAHGTPLVIPDESLLTIQKTGLDGSQFAYRGEDYRLTMPGAHQVQNAATALAAVETLQSRGFTISQAAVAAGLEGAQWKGRVETVREKPLCLIDGAHNHDAMKALCGMADTLLKGRRLHIIMAMSANKDYNVCIPMMAQRAECFIAAQAPGAPKALPAGEVARIAAKHCGTVHTCENLQNAVACALELAADDDVILACGSLYMVGAAKRWLKG